MADIDNFTEMMNRLRDGDNQAAAQLFHSYHQRLRALAHKRLAPGIRQKVDADDVLQSVFKSFFHRHGLGQFQLEDWDSLWTLLTLITIRKCSSRVQYFLAASRSVQRETSAAGDESSTNWQPIADEPTPDEAAQLTETIEQVMRGMAKWECDILTLSLQGYSIEEIAPQVGRAQRTVERVRGRIKQRLLRFRDEAQTAG